MTEYFEIIRQLTGHVRTYDHLKVSKYVQYVLRTVQKNFKQINFNERKWKTYIEVKFGFFSFSSDELFN